MQYRDGRPTKIILVVFFLLIIAYAYFEARGIVFGPKIDITEVPQTLTDPYVLIRGKAERIATLTMNGRVISVTEEGLFEEPYVLSPGVNRIIFDAKDKYDRATQQTLEIVFTGDPLAMKTEEPDAASSTPLSATSTETEL